MLRAWAAQGKPMELLDERSAAVRARDPIRNGLYPVLEEPDGT
jgi:hypothetical protein